MMREKKLTAGCIAAVRAGNKTQLRQALRPQPPADAELLALDHLTPLWLTSGGAVRGEACPLGGPAELLDVSNAERPLQLVIDRVRVQRIQDISDADIKAEGAVWRAEGGDDGASERHGFARWWSEINARSGFTWDVNPWVWVVDFHIADGE